MTNLKKIIDEKGVQQRWLAEQVGVTEVSMSRYVSGERIPKAPLAIRMADALGVDVKELYGWEPEKRTEERTETHGVYLDVIRRQDAIDAIHCDITITGRQNAALVATTIGAFVDRIKALPPAESAWIPCSERLPEDTAIVTVETKTFKQKYVCEAVWIPRWSKKVEYDNWEDCSEYNEDEDEYYVLEGWYERVYNWDEYSYVGIEDNVIAWMPRPEPYDAERRTDD